MLKKHLLITLVLLLGAVLLGSCGGGGVADQPVRNVSYEGTTDMLAGQDLDVGDINIWNDTNYLHVEYVIEDLDWRITETHLHVADSVDGVPQTKKGNPIPGQFDYSMEHNPPVLTYTYDVPLAGLGKDLVVAAHAVVRSVYGDADPTMYLSEIDDNNGYKGPTQIFAVAYNNARYELTEVGTGLVTEGGTTFYSCHIAVSSDGLYIYGIDNFGNFGTSMRGHLAKYDIANDVTYDIGQTGLYDCTQLAFAPDTKLYAATTSNGSNASPNTLYWIDTATAQAHKVGKLGISIGGADMVFRDDGYLYVMTNGSSGLYKIDWWDEGSSTYNTSDGTSDGTFTAIKIWPLPGYGPYNNFTGLADTFDGAGSLIASCAGGTTHKNQFAVFATLGANPTYFDMYNYFDASDDPTYLHEWGDMTSLPAPDYTYETAWGDGVAFGGSNWATYYEYSVQ